MLPWRCRAWGWDSRRAGSEHSLEMKCKEGVPGRGFQQAVGPQFSSLPPLPSESDEDPRRPAGAGRGTWSLQALQRVEQGFCLFGKGAQAAGDPPCPPTARLPDCCLLSPPFGIRLPSLCCGAGKRSLTLPAFLFIFPFYLVPESLIAEGRVTGVKTWHTRKCGTPPRNCFEWALVPRSRSWLRVRKGRAQGRGLKFIREGSSVWLVSNCLSQGHGFLEVKAPSLGFVPHPLPSSYERVLG